MSGAYRIDKNFVICDGNIYPFLVYVGEKKYFIIKYDAVVELLNLQFNFSLKHHENVGRPISEHEALRKFTQSE